MTTASVRATLACERLTRSRETLRQGLRVNIAAAAAHKPPLAWLEGLNNLPGFGAVLTALRAWWSDQPLRKASLGVAEAAKTALLPIAQRAPLSLVLGALALGGLFVWVRPWRWLTAPTVLAGLMPQILSKVIANVPAQSWLAGLASLSPAQDQNPYPRSPESHPSNIS